MSRNLIYHKVASRLREHLSDSDRLFVGLSGGIDSVVLYDLAAEFCEKNGWPIPSAIHVNYQLRGPSADRAENISRALVEARAGTFYVHRLEPKQEGTLNEDNLREMRYQIFNDYLTHHSGAKIVLGHHLNDQVETGIMRLFSGANYGGLAAMSIIRDQAYLRPLLDCDRKSIEKHAHRRNLPFEEDQTNVDTRMQRNWVRHELIPMLKSRFGNINRRILNLIEDAKDLEEMLRWANRTSDIAEGKGDRVVLDLLVLNALPKLLQRFTLHQILGDIYGEKGLRDIGRVHVEALITLAAGEGRKEIALPRGVLAKKIEGRLTIERISKDLLGECR